MKWVCEGNNDCSMSRTRLRPELEPLPERMRDLPVDKRGYVVPWFVEWLNGEPEFRFTSQRKVAHAARQKLCWVCGQRLGANLCFVIGPMCAINRISSEPPSHLECAQWSARNCPFMARPHMVRREGDELSKECDGNVAGNMIKRNPGVTLLWVTRSYKVINDGEGKPLFMVGEPDHVEWYREGRAATRAEVEESVRTGLPLLEETTEGNEQQLAEIARRKAVVETLYP